MIYPSQVTQLKNFFDDMLSEYRRAGSTDVRVDCKTVERLMERAKELRDMLVVELVSTIWKEV